MASGTIPHLLGTIPEYSGDIDSYDGSHIFIATSGASGTLPTIGSANRFLILSDIRMSGNSITFGVQIAISFGTNKIAIRYASYASYAWSSWTYLTAS